jgi:hypothetical protein
MSEARLKNTERDDVVRAIAERLLDSLTSDNDAVEEIIEEYAASLDLTPLDPHPEKVGGKSPEGMTLEDSIVLGEYHRYEKFQRDLILEAWMELVNLLMDAVQQRLSEGWMNREAQR